MKAIKQVYTINTPLEKVWRSLVDPKIIKMWGGGSVVMDDKLGTNFSLWGGEIHGTNTKVVENKELVQDWYGGDWEKPSKVTFKISSKGGQTQIDLIHEDIPDSQVDDIEDGWKRYYLGPLKAFLEK